MSEKIDGNIIQFLNGSHSYEGVWYGDYHPTRKGAFWWRSILEEWFKQQIIDAAAFGNGRANIEDKQSLGEQYYTQTYKS